MFSATRSSNAHNNHHKPRKAVISKRVFTWDFISGEMKYFHFSVWSISYNCLDDASQNENHCGCCLIVAILIEMKFRVIPEMKSCERKHLQEYQMT